MTAEEELARISPDKDTKLTVGVFDGVHLGHQYLISQLKEHARQQNLLSGVVTFRQHPDAVLSPQTRLPFLTDITTRTRLLKKEGADFVVTLSFTRNLASLSARDFVSLLKKHLRMRALLVGPDFALGQRREGGIAALEKLGREMGFEVIAVPPIVINGEVVSSTAIRKALTEGDMAKVSRLTGHHFRLHGPVVKGAQRGAGLGYPTANIEVDSQQALPAEGVYLTCAYLRGKAYPAMTNIGKCPTFDTGKCTVEVHILEYRGDIYGKELTIDIIQRIRGEKKFDTPEQLAKQIAEDIKQGRAILGS